MNKSLIKQLLYSFLIDPLFYLCTVLNVLFTAFSFFFINRFFLIETSTTDLSFFFNSFAQITVITTPLLFFRLNYFINTDDYPIGLYTSFFSISLSVFIAQIISLVFLFSIPVSVNFFGSVDFGQIFCGYAGLLFYICASCCFVHFLFIFFNNINTFLALFWSILFLLFFNFIHLIPLYLKTGDFISSLLQKISFAWHFDSWSKGILDTRNLLFYFYLTLCISVISVTLKKIRISLNINKTRLILLLFSLVFSSIGFSKIYLRFDFTKNKTYSTDKITKELCRNLENPLRITYYQSKELKKYYPQSRDIIEYLKQFASANKNITFSVEKADADKLSNLGIRGQQLKSQNSTKIEYNYVYSTIQLQYLDKSSFIPFVISNKTLEYDLAQRIQQLISKKERNVYVCAANSFSVDEDYVYLENWLISRGFTTTVLPKNLLLNTLSFFDYSTTNKPILLLLGTSQLTDEESFAIKIAAEKGMPVLVLTNPYSVDIKNDWKISSNNNAFIKILNDWGFVFDNSLAQDLSNFPLTLSTEEKQNLSYQTINYPLWISVLPQEDAHEGVTVCWASPILCYGKVLPLLKSSPYAWIQKSSNKKDDLFIINPFLIPKSASQAEEKNQTVVLAAYLNDEAKKTKVAVISDQYFVSSIMTGYTSTNEYGDFRNYDYLASLILRLRGDDELKQLLQKSHNPNSLYKITQEEKFNKTKTTVIKIIFIVIPAIVFIFGFIFNIVRRLRYFKANEKQKN